MSLKSIDQLSLTQRHFVQWNAARLEISEAESFERLKHSWNTIDGGYGGDRFRNFNVTCHDVFQVLYGDNEDELFDSYEYFAPLHMLRMLSYPELKIKPDNLIVTTLQNLTHITILDFGCGLAQVSRALASFFTSKGISVNLFLADIPTIRKDFLLYLGDRSGIKTTFLNCTRFRPIPSLPTHHICIATEFFEHVHEPIKYFEAIDSALQPEGVLVTNTADHNKEFMHVSPNLEALREALAYSNYEVLKKNRVYRKLDSSN